MTMLEKYLYRQRMRLLARSLLEGACAGTAVSALYALISTLTSGTFYPSLSLIYGSALFFAVLLFRFFYLFPEERLARFLFLNINEGAERVLTAILLKKERSRRTVNHIWEKAYREFTSEFEGKGESIYETAKFPVKPSRFFSAIFALGLVLWIYEGFYLVRMKQPEANIAKSMVIEISPPRYTGISDFEVTDFTVPVSVPFGSRISLRGVAEKKTQEIQVNLKEVSFPCTITSRFFTCPLSIAEPGRYTLRLKGLIGVRWFFHRTHVEVNVLNDEKPRVRLIEPVKDLTLTKPEAVKITFEASDDYALKSASLTYKLNGGEPVTEPIKIPPGEPHIIHSFLWDLKNLPEAEVIEAWVEVRDNNPFVDGGAGARSRVFTIEVMTPLKRFKKFLRALSRVLWSGVDLLGFIMEKVESGGRSNPPLHLLEAKEDELSKEYKKALSVFDDFSGVAMRWANEVNARYLALMKAVMERRKAWGTGVFSTVVRLERISAEDFVYVLDKFIRDKTVELIRREIEGLLKKKEELLSRLEESKNPEKILQELQLLEMRLRKLLNELAEQLAEYSDEFYNRGSSTGREMPPGDSGLLQQIRDALKKGDVKRAKELLREYFKNLEDFYSKLDELKFRMGTGLAQEMKTMSEVALEIKELSMLQKSILKRHLQALNQATGMKEEDLTGELEKLRRSLKESESKFNSYCQRKGSENSPFVQGLLNFGTFSFQRAGEALNSGDMKELERELRNLKNLLGRLPLSDDEMKGVRESLEDALKSLRALDEMSLSEEARRSLSHDEGSVAGRLSRLLRKADELGSQELMEKLEGAKEGAEGAEKSIKENKNASALLKEEKVIKYLEEAKNQLKKLRQKMSSSNLTYLLQQLDELMGRGDVRVGEVEIPKEEKYRLKEELRKMIEEALKMGLPQESKDKNERYYREIVE